MRYITIERFKDKNGTIYKPGDVYPNRGRASKARLEELSTDNNRYGFPFIEPEYEDDQE